MSPPTTTTPMPTLSLLWKMYGERSQPVSQSFSDTQNHRDRTVNTFMQCEEILIIYIWPTFFQPDRKSCQAQSMGLEINEPTFCCVWEHSQCQGTRWQRLQLMFHMLYLNYVPQNRQKTKETIHAYTKSIHPATAWMEKSSLLFNRCRLYYQSGMGACT